MKNWKVKEEGGMSFLFKPDKEYFYTKEEAIAWMKEHLPKGGIYSQSVHHKLFERNGLFRWKLRGCYIRDTRYYNDNGKDLAEPLKDVVLACEHVKKHLDNLDKNGIKKCNQMFGIRASWLRGFCPKDCKLNPFKEVQT